MNFIIFIFIVISLVLILPGIKIAKKNSFIESPFSLNITKGIAGYFAFCALIHQLVNVVCLLPTYQNELIVLEHMGVLLVGFFFLFSGYGLIVSYEEKENYLKTFIVRRVCTVLIPFFICNYAYMTTTLLMGNQFTIKQLIQAFFGIILLNNHMWFAVEILLLYLAFFVIFRYVNKEKYKYIFMGLVVIALIVFSFLLGHDIDNVIQMNWFHGEWWYNTTLLFFLGMLLAKNRISLIGFAQKHYKTLIVIFLTVFIVLWNATEYMLEYHGYWTETPFDQGYGDKLITLSVQLPMVICFEILLLLIMLKVRIHNKLLQLLGKISLEVILLENVFLLCLEDYTTKNLLLYTLFTITGTVMFAILINKIKLIVLEKK